jgi:cytochrome c biogenesis protein ResB
LRINNNFSFYIFHFTLFILLIGCGYKPSSVYQNKIIGENIEAIVTISAKNPRETAFLKDALNDAVYSIFGANLANTADTKIILSISSSSLEPLDYDENGFPILYRSAVKLKAKVIDKHSKIHNYTVKGNYDFAISPNSIITDQLKLNSFKQASINALDVLLAEITKDGAKYEH